MMPTIARVQYFETGTLPLRLDMYCTLAVRLREDQQVCAEPVTAQIEQELPSWRSDLTLAGSIRPRMEAQEGARKEAE